MSNCIKDGILPTIVPTEDTSNTLCTIWSSWCYMSLNINIIDGVLYTKQG